jgi:hypothetical protein
VGGLLEAELDGGARGESVDEVFDVEVSAPPRDTWKRSPAQTSQKPAMSGSNTATPPVR